MLSKTMFGATVSFQLANPEALEVMARRFDGVRGIRWVGFDPRAALARSGAAGPVA